MRLAKVEVRHTLAASAESRKTLIVRKSLVIFGVPYPPPLDGLRRSFSPLFSPHFANYLVSGLPDWNRIFSIVWGALLGEERRKTPRFPFIANSEILVKGVPAGNPSKVTELSLYGCFVETASPFEKGAQFLLKVYAEGKYFESQGTVLYSQPGQGMGVGFQNVNPHYLSVLKMWLISAAHAKFGKKD